MKKTLLRKLISAFLFTSLLSSCEMLQGSFQKPVKEFFKEYTENAVIVVEEMPDTYNLDASGIKAYPGNQDLSLNFILRNPQNYKLDFGYSFNNSAVAAKVQAGDVSFVQSEDKNSVVLTFSQRFLNEIDKDNIGKKNLSGHITLHEPKTDRNFESYGVSLSANTVPPQILGAIVLLYTESGNQTYMLCFNMPKLAGTVHEKDTYKLTLRMPELDGGNLVYKNKTISVNGDTLDFGSETGFSTSAPVSGTLTPSSGGNFEAETNGYTQVYYSTGLAPQATNISYTIYLSDNNGLTSTSLVGNNTPRLNPPSVVDASGNSLLDGSDHTFIVDEDTGLASVYIRESGISSFYKDDGNGNLGVDSTRTETGASISWRVLKEDGSEYISGTNVGSAEIKLPKGKYTVQASETKLNNVGSVAVITKTSGIIMKTAPKYYVSSSGDDANTGKRNSPFRTIQKAIDEIEANEDAGTGITAADNPAGEIYLMSDIEIPKQIKFTATGGAGIKSYILSGYGSKKRITKAADYSGNGSIIYRDNSATARNITLQNLIISGETSTGYSLIFYSENNPSCALTVLSCTFSGNTIRTTEYAGPGAVIRSVRLVIRDSEISGNIIDLSNCKNTSDYENLGSVIYCSYVDRIPELSNVTIKDNVLKKGTFAKKITYNGAVYAKGDYKISGKNIITGNYYDSGTSKEYGNLYIPTGKTVTVTGSLAGSKIGITTADAPAAVTPVTFTSGFAAYNSTTKPSDVFVSDQGYAIGYSGSEAAAVVSSAVIQPEYEEEIEIRSNTSVMNLPSAAKDVSGRTVSFNVYNKSTGTNVTDSANLQFTVKYLGSVLDSNYVKKNGNSVEFTTKVGEGFYYISVVATVNGRKYSSTHTVEIKDVPLARNYGAAPADKTVFGVSSQADMEKLSQWAAGNSESRIYTVYILEDFTLSSFPSISKETSDKAFAGTFNGNGHTITITNAPDDYQGLFYRVGATGKDTVIKNLTLAGDVTVQMDVCGFLFTNEGVESIVIENCVNKMNITGNDAAGIGYSYQLNSYTIKNCINEGNITATFSNGRAAGITNTVSNISNCVNKGTIKADYAGGITCSGVPTNCVNRGNVIGNIYAGGIGSGNPEAYNCINYGKIEGKMYVAGITGCSNSSKIKNNVNLGKVVLLETGQNNYNGAIMAQYGGLIKDILNNYYLDDNIAGIGAETDKHAPYVYSFVSNNYASSTSTPVTIGTLTSTDVVSLLNKWVEDSNYSDYSKWTYDSNGLPKLLSEE